MAVMSFWSEAGPGIGSGHMRVDTLLPLALLEMGHEVKVALSHYGDISSIHPTLAEDLRKLSMLPREKIEELFPADIFVLLCSVCNIAIYSSVGDCLRRVIENRKKVGTFVYYALDLWEGWAPPSERSKVNEVEKRIVEMSDVVCAVSPHLCVHMSRKYGRKVWWLPNAARMRWFNPPVWKGGERERIAALIGGYFKYVGIAEIRRLAEKYPDWTFYVIGYGFASEQEKNKVTHSAGGNFFILDYLYGPPLAEILAQIRVGIITGIPSPFYYFGDASKWYSYHAAGMAIIDAPPQPHRPQFPKFYPHTYFGRTLEEAFEQYLREDKGEKKTPMDIHDYSHRAQIFMETLDGKEGYGYAEEGVFKPGTVVTNL